MFWFPALVMMATGNSGVSNGWRTLAWTAALCVLGTGCLLNAKRCGRVHCYLTGPFFLFIALVTLLYGLGVLHVRGGWGLLGLIILAGGVVLCCVPEMFLGKYRKQDAAR